MLIQPASSQLELVRSTVVLLENSVTVRKTEPHKRMESESRLITPCYSFPVLHTPVSELSCPGKTRSPMASIKPGYSHRSMTPETSMVKRKLRSPFTDCTTGTVIQLGEDKTTDYAHLKQASTEEFPVIRNRLELETRFFASFQKHNQKPSDFVYILLKIHKILKLEMTEEKLMDHVINRLEPQIFDYVEVRHPQTTSNLLQKTDKNEERFLNRKIRDSSWEFRDTNPSENNRFPNRNWQ
ncbi:uncharacterized protein TNCV_4897791 [Trichonephila clavipes]|nr:uncharacterized protein TNCV_4897791 [Trichonephila clavipes]